MDLAWFFALGWAIQIVLWVMALRQRDTKRDEAIVLRAQLSAFDHDGDGRAGGSRKRSA